MRVFDLQKINRLGGKRDDAFQRGDSGLQMRMTIDQIAPEALKLSLPERALLAASLWESIEDPFLIHGGKTDEEALALAIERDAEMESGAVTGISHAELMERLRR